jgi:hypothetical protein
MTFDVIGQIGKEINDFDNTQVYIAGIEPNTGRYLGKANKGYYFSQKKVLSLIDLYYNSKYETGEFDSEGQRKLFLNICAFRADVASKQIDLDTKDFSFIPDGKDQIWSAFFIQKKFRQWARESYFGEFINELVENFPKYGTLVVKKVGKKLERVPLRNLIVKQDAKDLQTSQYVIEEHRNMTLEDMKAYPDWDTENVELQYGETTTVYERYGLVPYGFYCKAMDIDCPEGQEDELYDCVVVATCKANEKKGSFDGNILFIEQVKERPYLECHWKKQDGRWLGVGEIENQFENQVARNMISNMRTRSLKWSSKKLFQSKGDAIAKNLIRDVKDGDVLEVGPNGDITQIDSASRQMGEYQAAEDLWENNSNQKSFTFEVATGEALPSGTPFRLGVVLSNAVNSHFGLKKEKLGLFLKKLVVEFVYDIFIQENRDEHTISFLSGEEGFETLRNTFIENEMRSRVVQWAMSDNQEIPNFETMKQLVTDAYGKHQHLFIESPKDFYKNAKLNIELTLTGEEIDVQSKVTSLTTLYQSLVQAGDPRADKVLARIMSLQGENLEVLLGEKPQPVQQNQQVANQQQVPSPLNQLAQQNAPQTL